jgi:hypothetical protein
MRMKVFELTPAVEQRDDEEGLTELSRHVEWA